MYIFWQTASMTLPAYPCKISLDSRAALPGKHDSSIAYHFVKEIAGMKKVKVGIAGLGRLGKEHAKNLAFKIANAELAAACSIVPAELEFAQ